MKKLILFITGVLAAVVILDYAAGVATRGYLRTHRLPGDCASIDYTVKDIDEDVIILGNSVILNSLMPSVLSDSIGMSVYNSASNGQELIFFYSLLDCILQRHTPKAIILGLRGDLFTSEGIGDRYSILSPYYGMGYEVIDSCLNSTSDHAPMFMKSTFYRYNTIWWRILLYHFITPNEQGENGFIAKPIPPMAPELQPSEENDAPKTERLNTLKMIIDRCREKGVRLIAVFPPLYYERHGVAAVTDAVKALCAANGVAVIDDSTNPYYLSHPELFYDNTHLNKDGALHYSMSKAGELKTMLSK